MEILFNKNKLDFDEFNCPLLKFVKLFALLTGLSHLDLFKQVLMRLKHASSRFDRETRQKQFRWL